MMKDILTPNTYNDFNSVFKNENSDLHRMISSFTGRLPSAENGNENSPKKQVIETRPASVRCSRRQILASIGQPPRATRVGSRRGFESRSLDRSDGYRSSNYYDSLDSAKSNNGAAVNDVTDTGKFRDDYSRREFIEKLRHFEQLTVQSAKEDSLATGQNSCQSVPLARRPPPPPPSAPPKPPYQPHPEIENRLRFFDAAFGRHSNLRDRRLENLVSGNTGMSTSVLSPHSSADDSMILYGSSSKPSARMMSYSMTASPAPGRSGIDVLNRISNQLMLSTNPSPLQPEQSASTSRSLQATEAELRRELENLDSMLNTIQVNKNSTEIGNKQISSHNNNDNKYNPTSPLAALARDRRHSVATGAMSATNGYNTRIPRIQPIVIPSKPTSPNVRLLPANLRAEIINYCKPKETKNNQAEKQEVIKPVKPAGETNSPSVGRSDFSHSPSPSPPTVTINGKQTRVVLVRSKPSLGDHNSSNKIAAKKQPEASNPLPVQSVEPPNDSSMLSPSTSSSSASSSQETSVKASETLGDMPPPPTPSPPSREQLSSDSSTPPPHVVDKKTESEVVSNGPKTTVSVFTSLTTDTGTTTAKIHASADQQFDLGQPSPSLTPSTSNSDSTGALSGPVQPAPVAQISTSGSVMSSPLISAHKQHQQILRDISTLRHCLIDIETQQQNILQEVSALRAEATAVNEVEAIKESLHATEKRYELEKERADARLAAAREKVITAMRDLQHLEKQRIIATPAGNSDPKEEEEGDEQALAEAKQNIESLQDDADEAEFELAEAVTRFEDEKKRLVSRLGAANEVAADAAVLWKKGNTAGLIGGSSSYDYWIRRLTEHYRQLDEKRELIKRNLVKLQAAFNAQMATNSHAVASSENTTNSSVKESNSTDCSISCGNSSNNEKDNSDFCDTKPKGDLETTENESVVEDKSPDSAEVSKVSVRLRQNGPKASLRMIPPNERPRTLFLPQPDNLDLDLREHLDALSHDWRSCSHVILSSDGSSCRGWLHKLTSRLPALVRPWSKRWFVFSRQQQKMVYYSDSNEHNLRGEIPFSTIFDVYVESATSTSSSGHKTHRPPNSCSNLLIVVKTEDRRMTLAAPSPQAARIWVDVLCTGAAGNQSYDEAQVPGLQQSYNGTTVRT